MQPPQLRPLSIGDVLDAAFRLYRQHFVTFLGISALLQVPMVAIQLVAQLLLVGSALERIMEFSANPPLPAPGTNPLDAFPLQEFATFMAVSLGLSAIYYLLIHNIASAALANAVAHARRGEPVSILRAYALSPRTYLSVIGASLAPVALSFGLMVVIVGCGAGAFGALSALSFGRNLSGGAGLAAGLVIGLLAVGLIVLLVLVSTFAFVRLALATPAIVLEGAGPLRALGRSWRLVGRAFWRTLLLVFLMGLLTYFVSSLPAAVANSAVSLATRDPLGSMSLSQGVSSLVAYVGIILALPLQLALYTVLFDDLRVRSEGYDLALRASEL